ncbi:RHS repeat domain-containing protein, partial [Buttiauxella ferragutiae]|uniref:RHS repeat domain-containing protein n=1 Tax=Buttiauxella ferragutiae TaxID=82989 RepID=UPI0035253335
TGNSSVPMREERFTYDQNLNITRRQTWVNDVMESEAYQQQQHGRVASREHKAWRHTTSRINPDSGKPEDGKFVRVVNEHNITWKYDVNGRLVEKLVDKGGYRPLQWRYRWDARSQLTALETPDGERWEYRYDPSGRRISKRCTNRQKTGYNFHWNGDQLTEEIPVYAGGTPAYDDSIRWIYEPGSFTPLARYEKGQLHYAVTDTVGRIQELLTEDGTIVWRGKQQLWGREESANDDKLSCRLRFPGQYEDTESGLHYNRFRYYDSETGQYISADPIGLAGGINLYSYAPNPLKWVDPLGLCKGDATQSQVQVNRANGKAAEALLLDKLSINPNVTVLGTQVYVKTPGVGRGRYVDILIQNNKTGNIIGVEVKSGGATRSSTQIAKDKVITSGGGVFGKNAPTDMNGNPLAGLDTSGVLVSETNVPLWKLP